MTAVSRAIWTSAQWNAHVRANLLETMVGKAATTGGYFVSTGANAIAERAAVSATVATSQTRSSEAYGDLATTGPSVTCTTGSEALVWIACRSSSSLGGGAVEVGTTTAYACTDSATFDSGGGNRAGFDDGHMFQGYFSSTNGNQFSLATFNSTQMQSDLSGATVSKTEVFLNNLHFYQAAGGSAIIGTHALASITGDVTYSSIASGITSSHFNYGESKWVTVPNSIGNAFKAGTAKGISIGKGPSSSNSYYSYFAGDGQSGEPQVRITYSKPGISGGYTKASFSVSGASSLPADDAYSLYMSGMTANKGNRWGVVKRITSLTPGSNTFTMKYAAGTSGATGTFLNREIIVMPM